MQETLKQKVLEFVSIAKECPEPLQVKCFELLLSDYLAHQRTKTGEKEKKAGEIKPPASTEQSEEKDARKTAQQEDIQETDLHVKARQFLKKSTLSVEHINQLFYKEEGNFLPLYDDLKTTQAAESQIRIALLHALLNGMHSGDFEFNGESVREETTMRKCYDPANFTAIFKKNQVLFDGFDKYDKRHPTIRLSAEGKERLAEIIRELQ
jgi:hypothetical protein